MFDIIYDGGSSLLSIINITEKHVAEELGYTPILLPIKKYPGPTPLKAYPKISDIILKGFREW